MIKDYSHKINYVRKLFINESEILAKIDQSIVDNDLPIHIKPEEGKFLQFLIKLIDAKKIVEIGTLAGYSTTWMADALPEDGKIYTIEHDKKRHQLAENNFKRYKHNDKIISIIGKAADILPNIVDQAPFDLIFIDADKPSYNLYLDWAEYNIRKNGLIIADDTFLSGAVYLDQLPQKVKQSTRDLMHKFNQRLADPSRYHSIMFANEKGLTVAIKLF